MQSEYSLLSTNSQAPFESTEMLDRNDIEDVDKKRMPAKAKKDSFTLSSFFSHHRRNNNFESNTPRIIQINNGTPNPNFLGNQVSTAKYNPLSFLPKFLYVEFSKSANLFFLFISGIQVT